MTTRAQKFYNLTAQQVKIDSVAPTFAAHYADGEELWQALTAGAVSTAAAE